MAVVDRRKAAHQPERDGRQLAVGVGNVFHNGDQCAEECGYDRTAEDQRDRGRHLGNASGKGAEHHRQKRERKRGEIDRHTAAEADDGEARAEARAVGNAENAGIDQRIAEHALECRAGHSQ